MPETVLFVPGFFGFGSFGPKGKPLIEYFARVQDVLRLALGSACAFEVHQPPPTASLEARVGSLHIKFVEVLGRTQRVHLVAHSTGGLDARLLLHPRYRWEGAPTEEERARLIDRVGSLVTLSAPFHGTPIAQRLLLGAGLTMPVLYFASILASRGRLRLLGQLANLTTLGKRLLEKQTTPTEQLIAELAGVDGETAHQIRRFLQDVSRDHLLVGDLAPAAMAGLNRKLETPELGAGPGAEFPRIASFVTVAPRPGAGLSNLLSFAGAPLQRTLYDAAYALSLAPPPTGVRLPEGPWIGPRLGKLGPLSSDGVVPAWSQTLNGRAAGLVEGDHLDVIGHYESAGATFFRSGSHFDDVRFKLLWLRIAEAIQRAEGDE